MLTEAEAAQEAGVKVEAVRLWVAMGLLEPVTTPEGYRYNREAIRSLLVTAWQPALQWQPPPARAEYFSPAEAGRIVGVSTQMLRMRAGEGRVGFSRTAGGMRRYAAADIRAIAAQRRKPGFAQWWPPPKTS